MDDDKTSIFRLTLLDGPGFTHLCACLLRLDLLDGGWRDSVAVELGVRVIGPPLAAVSLVHAQVVLASLECLPLRLNKNHKLNIIPASA
jgi:hypothetical protein